LARLMINQVLIGKEGEVVVRGGGMIVEKLRPVMRMSRGRKGEIEGERGQRKGRRKRQSLRGKLAGKLPRRTRLRAKKDFPRSRRVR